MTLQPGDLGTEALIQHWKAQRYRATAVAAASGSVSSSAALIGVEARGEVGRVIDVPSGQLIEQGEPPTPVVAPPELLFGVLVETSGKTTDGDLIVAVTPAFQRFLRELARDPNAFYSLTSRQMEELVAGGYEEYGGKVTLTPRSGDHGRDVIVVMPDFGTIRILDQVKLYAPNRPVPAGDVRALYGVLANDLAASKGVITTTSRFAPGVAEEFARQIPSRIELRDGQALLEWLLRLKASS